MTLYPGFGHTFKNLTVFGKQIAEGEREAEKPQKKLSGVGVRGSSGLGGRRSEENSGPKVIRPRPSILMGKQRVKEGRRLRCSQTEN